MWRIESTLDDAGASYDRRAALYDGLVRSRVYNRLAWSASPSDYERFASAAVAEGDGPLLELAAGTAAATAALHARSGRPTVLVDLSRAMLERAAARIAAHAGTPGALPPHVRLVQADLFALPFAPGGFTTVLGLGLIHLFDDPGALVAAARASLAPAGRVHLSGLTAETRRARRYLEVLRRAGEVAPPRRAGELRTALGAPGTFTTAGCMAYATFGPCPPERRPDATTWRALGGPVSA